MSRTFLKPIPLALAALVIGAGVFVWANNEGLREKIINKMIEFTIDPSARPVKIVDKPAEDIRTRRYESPREPIKKKALEALINEALMTDPQDWQTERAFGYSFSYPKVFGAHGSLSDSFDKPPCQIQYANFYNVLAIINPTNSDEHVLSTATNSGYGHGANTFSYAKEFLDEEIKSKNITVAPKNINYQNIVIDDTKGTLLTYSLGNEKEMRFFFPLRNKNYLIVLASYQTKDKNKLIDKIVHTLRFKPKDKQTGMAAAASTTGIIGGEKEGSDFEALIADALVTDTQNWKVYNYKAAGLRFSYPAIVDIYGPTSDSSEKYPCEVDYTSFYSSLGAVNPTDAPGHIVGFAVNDDYGHGIDTLTYAKNFLDEEITADWIIPENVNYQSIAVDKTRGTILTYSRANETVMRLFFPLKDEKYLIVLAYYQTENKKKLIDKIIRTLTFQ